MRPGIERWSDVVIAEPDTISDPLTRIGVELCLESRLLPWATGLPATTNYERWFESSITRITETP